LFWLAFLADDECNVRNALRKLDCSLEPICLMFSPARLCLCFVRSSHACGVCSVCPPNVDTRAVLVKLFRAGLNLYNGLLSCLCFCGNLRFSTIRSYNFIFSIYEGRYYLYTYEVKRLFRAEVCGVLW
jgi:hypothetical protein